MMKAPSFLKLFLASLFLALCAGSVVLGIYGYRIYGNQKARINAKDAEIEKLGQAQMDAEKAITEAKEKRKVMEDEIERLKKTVETTEDQKKLILSQVRSSVDSFDTFRAQTTEEMNKLRTSVTNLDAERKALTQKLDAVQDTSKDEATKMQDRISTLTQSVEDSKLLEAKLRANVRKKTKASIVLDASRMHYNLGNFYFRGRNFDAAAKEYNKALFYNPNDPEANFNLATISDQELDDWDTAMIHYRKYMQLRPNDKDAARISEKILDLEIKAKVAVDTPRTRLAKDAVKEVAAGNLGRLEMADDKK
jgi:tetratricopeptide (TPR) repeat protein